MSIGDVLAAAVGEDCTASEAFGEITVDVPASSWVTAVTTARDLLRCRYFDWLTAVDELAEGYSVVCHLWSIEQRHGLLIRTRLPLETPHLATLTGVFAGAAWHERETYEMFGVVFDGHPHLVPLLLPDGFEGHPLRKEFVLASRVAKDWPGAREPGEGHGGPVRRRMRPPGVPDPADWGPSVALDPSPPGPAQDPGKARPVGAGPILPGSPGTAGEGVDPTHPPQDPGRARPVGAGPILPGSPGVLGGDEAAGEPPEKAP